jgi:hypothetical protein
LSIFGKIENAQILRREANKIVITITNVFREEDWDIIYCMQVTVLTKEVGRFTEEVDHAELF